MTADRNRRALLWAGAAAAAVAVAAWAAAAGSRATAPMGVTPDPPEPTERVVEAESFWSEIGRGDAAAALERLDPASDPTLRHYAAFAAGLPTGLEPETCRATGPDTVRCSLRTTDPAMLGLYSPGAHEYASGAAVTFGDAGISGFTLPGLVGGVALRLYSHAREGPGVPEECRRANYDSLDLPRFSTTIAQTGPCAEALAELIPAALGPGS